MYRNSTSYGYAPVFLFVAVHGVSLFLWRSGQNDFMIVACRVVDLVDGIDNIDDVLHWYALVGSQHHSGLTVVTDFGVDEVGELSFVGRGFINEILVLVVHVDGEGLLGHGLAAARWQHELDGVWGNQSRGQHEENQQQKHQV